MSNDLESRRNAWKFRGDLRPDFEEVPGPGKESVWDYPRPPILVDDSRLVEVFSGEQCIVSTSRARRLLETAHAPTWYIPMSDVNLEYLAREDATSHCEWKGEANYFSIQAGGKTITRAAWSYRAPFPEMLRLRNHFAFYPHLVDCYVAGEKARPQGGGFYGGWITNDLAGPIKGQDGSQGW
ncbi:MAG: DUF427 domain-containing protein [Polyangiaceae bacterium]|nr:DUF427 domain-containing protein [Polyangiaceae bacterium]